MPRGKKIIIETEVNDDLVNKFRSINVDQIKKERDSNWATATTFISARNIYTSEFPGLEDNKIISFKIQLTLS